MRDSSTAAFFGRNALISKGATVSTRALPHSDLETSQGSLRFAEIYSGRLSAFLLNDGDASIYVSAASALRCAKGALTAIGMEAVAAAMAYCLYEMIRHAILFR
jgi:hypothetical protein